MSVEQIEGNEGFYLYLYIFENLTQTLPWRFPYAHYSWNSIHDDVSDGDIGE
jgi:hypothetical protein